MKVEKSRWWQKFLVAGALAALVAGTGSTLPSAYAGGMIKGDDDKWISVGVGLRTSFTAKENSAPNGDEYSTDFNLDNARVYINGQLHKYIGFTFNTECFNCSVKPAGQEFGSNSAMGLLDAIAKFEVHPMFNIWAGRTLLPSERGELNGPYYHATYDGFRTPFFPADQSGNFNSGAGLYGRDNAVVLFGKVHPAGTHLLYAVSVSQGLRGLSGMNREGSLMYTGRLQWNLLNDEDNPGYYTSGTYYGTGGDIFAIAANVQHQKDGAGSASTGGGLRTADFTGMSADVLLEKLMPNDLGVVTFNAEFKRFWADTGKTTATSSDASFNMFDGVSWTVYGLYLIPTQVGWGRFQPYMRFTSIDPRYGNLRQEWEPGINYVINGHNARMSVFYRYGDSGAGPAGAAYATSSSSQKVDSFTVAFQWQY